MPRERGWSNCTHPRRERTARRWPPHPCWGHEKPLIPDPPHALLPRSSPARAGEVSASSPTEGAYLHAVAPPDAAARLPPARRHTTTAPPPPPSRTRAPPPRCAWGRIWVRCSPRVSSALLPRAAGEVAARAACSRRGPFLPPSHNARSRRLTPSCHFHLQAEHAHARPPPPSWTRAPPPRCAWGRIWMHCSPRVSSALLPRALPAPPPRQWGGGGGGRTRSVRTVGGLHALRCAVLPRGRFPRRRPLNATLPSLRRGHPRPGGLAFHARTLSPRMTA
jgi:hypothetical protein